MRKIAISLGDINGIGPEIALKTHEEISKFMVPIYCINKELLSSVAKKLNLSIPSDMKFYECGECFDIKPGKISKKSGKFSFDSFKNAIKLAKKGKADAITTLPINKEAWSKAKVPFVGHTDYLRHKFKKDAIMMLGCNELFVALFTDHIPLGKVSKQIKSKKFYKFLISLHKCTKFEKIGVLGFNPHASDNGVLGGKEESEIKIAINRANRYFKKDIFIGPLVPDAAFNPSSLKKLNKIAAIYHDQGLTPLKALYFDKSINVSLNLPIIRTSVDHGTAFNIAYKGIADTSSYIEAIKFAVKLCES
ncbi:4-hydroxythreonine-4-phosphate dehydrogenase [Campylobacter sp. RM16187]|uniref:4-hydroxythreonine-4-phosphate dehydrogenase n=1 Tax=Campylobacter sp. RM16187 TaxID=1660063 RepID=UPI0021B57FD9|nr:4-hydroxythreonine-4-phosphate dehydrogenase [Campylobacter sp. RM16187]QKG29394.1 4-hydroxy-L-threonine phosphate dehydrogenase, NAD-dependent [Campylobacter sp. RM16187]